MIIHILFYIENIHHTFYQLFLRNNLLMINEYCCTSN